MRCESKTFGFTLKRFVLRALSGLEPVVVGEALLRFDRRARWLARREVVVEAPEEEAAGTAAELVQLATVDDAFLELRARGPVSRAKVGLAEILAMLDEVDVRGAVQRVLDWRGASWPALSGSPPV